MPIGPQGQKRAEEVIERAIHIAQIATGEAKEIIVAQPPKRKISLAKVKSRGEHTTSKNYKVNFEEATAARPD